MTDVIKKVLPVNFKRTIRQTMIRSYVAQGPQVPVQSSENNFLERDGTGKYGFWSAYRQLFLFAMRHFCPLTDEHPHGFSQLARSRCLDQSELWQRLKKLLAKLGFILPRSQNNVLASSVECIAIRTFLTRLRPPELFVYDESNISEWSTKIADFLCSMPPRIVTGLAPAQTWDKTEDWCLGQRCGMTNTETFFSDQRYLFLENIYSADQAAQENITTFAVKRDIFRFFFTELDDIGPGLMQSSDTIKDTSTNSDRSGEGQLVITVPQQVDPIQDHNGTNQDAEMDDVEYTVTPAVFPPSNAVSIIHPQTEIAPNATANSQDSFADIKIVSQSDKACNCTIGLTPDDFYASVMNLPTYCGIIFCEIDTREVLFLRVEFANEFYNLINDLGDRWFARVDGPNFPLRTLAIGDIPALFQTLPCFIFHGRKGSFKSKLSPTMATAIELPCFNPETNMWVLQSGN
ncbi:hypothetical protein N7492_001816 [Penicillium capsulatum]|uniref:Uncharacterized protein n=1 Tax=Penicillium capsulatum TaxID=69766 RepID=A0A9W9IWH5_9EURO|nr:hypothetical protein N7492_001816 [Penicillium capsulatum]KAJ6129135.1 hypothetical protein N7512_001915 [Penicillium capsulatum]